MTVNDLILLLDYSISIDAKGVKIEKEQMQSLLEELMFLRENQNEHRAL